MVDGGGGSPEGGIVAGETDPFSNNGELPKIVAVSLQQVGHLYNYLSAGLALKRGDRVLVDSEAGTQDRDDRNGAPRAGDDARPGVDSTRWFASPRNATSARKRNRSAGRITRNAFASVEFASAGLR